MITKYIKGDITETELKYIAHGVNCQNVMGSGVAKALYSKFPKVKTKYHEFCKENDISLLGLVNIVYNNEDKTIFNCFTQQFYGYDGKRYVNYPAIVDCFRAVCDEILVYQPFIGAKPDYRLAIPKIGCGLAGGDWNIVEQLINDTVGDDLEIWVYELEEKKYNKINGDPG
jgi:O-acetyl-ADP-ribose deacetylase (regulator of RNase III)